MRIIVDPIAIRGVGEYLKKETELLLTTQKQLISDIESVLTCYKGIDAQEFVNKYLEKANSYSTLIENLGYYSNYMIAIANRYSDILSRSKNNFVRNRILNEEGGEENEQQL